MPGEASAGLTTERESHPSLRTGEPTCPSCAWREKLRQRFDERAPSAGRVMAVEAADLKLQRHSFFEAWKIGGMPKVSAMDGRA